MEEDGDLQALQDPEEDAAEDEEERDDDDDDAFDWVAQDDAGDPDHSGDEEADSEFVSDAPAERSGHVAVTDRNRMYVWGGYKNAEAPGFVDLYLPRHELWVFDMETRRWRRQVSGGDLPQPMSGSCGACVEGVLYLFGGHHARGNTNWVYRLRLRASSFSWEKMKDLKGLAPTPKDKLGCWVHKNRLAYFGGYGYVAPAGHRGTFELDENSLVGHHRGRGWNNHVHVLNLETSTWSQPVTKGTGPTPRAAHACATLGNRGYVFGGRYMDHRLNDLYYVDLDTWEWSEMSVPQRGPVGRSWHSFAPVSPDHMFLFGGFTTSRETLSDAWLYSTSTNQWKAVEHGHTRSPRLWHTACTGPDGEVFVFGGCANNLLSHQQASHSNELLIFGVQPKSLLRCCTEAVVRHRQRLEAAWECLPEHLLHGVRQRIGTANTEGS